MDITTAVSANVKAIRESKKLTLDAAAELTGVSRSMLAQIEKGDVNPTITVLWKIANGYKVSFSSLTEEKNQQVTFIPESDARPLYEDNGRYAIYPIFTFDEKKLFEIYRTVISENGELKAQPHLKGTEEYITVFAGEAEITVDGTTYRLKKGDSLRFAADVPHSYKNSGSDTVEMNMLIYYA